MPRRAARKKRGRRGFSRRRAVLVALPVAAAVALAWSFWPFWQLSSQFAERPTRQPSRLYGRSPVLEPGDRVRPADLASELAALGYRRVERPPSSPGELSLGRSRIAVWLRPFPTPEGLGGEGLLEVSLSGGRVSRLHRDGRPVPRAALPPPLLATYLGPDRAERRPVAVADLPAHLVQAVLAAEDARFYQHPGLSPRGILRAAWVNLRGGELKQGGSTLTQQLVKNLFLTHERSLGRKVRELVLAVLIDLRYDKQAILTAYLNEIYWGTSDGVNLMGVGAAAWAYFGKPASELSLCESAVLAGAIRSPGAYSPWTRPERARERRDWVLSRLRELGWLEPDRAAAVAARPLCFDPHPVAARRALHFADWAWAEARRRYGIDDPTGGGWVLLSTLEEEAQRDAEEAVAWGAAALEKGWEKGSGRPAPLQAALVSMDPRTGALTAYVGGRDYGSSQFDRVAHARRQAGSAFKPIVYSAAFESGAAWPAGFVHDAPMTVKLSRTRTWSPRNSSGEHRGWVTVRTAVEESLNVPTVRVAMATDLRRVVEMARAMGIAGRLEPLPSLALGAFEVSPLELATAYATLAAGGLRPPVHALEGVLGPDGRPVSGRPLPPPRRAMSPQTAYMMTSVLQGVLERGTGRAARDQGVFDPLAGKTGTTNGRRDSWFAGYSPDRATLVWVGYDENFETRLSGTRAALPIWSRFTAAVRPEGGFRFFQQPPGIVTALIDPDTGQLATERCPRVLTEVYLERQLPEMPCEMHGGWYDRRALAAGEEGEARRRRWRWLRRIFGRQPPGGSPQR
ncbi:MAG: PBP1A family penicillin-binding protein [Thermoanaerobaculia bacterium]|nr:PBP1A family penicillin-binding protein [Thermoanaerobaculia bacterium]